MFTSVFVSGATDWFEPEFVAGAEFGAVVIFAPVSWLLFVSGAGVGSVLIDSLGAGVGVVSIFGAGAGAGAGSEFVEFSEFGPDFADESPFAPPVDTELRDGEMFVPVGDVVEVFAAVGGTFAGVGVAFVRVGAGLRLGPSTLVWWFEGEAAPVWSGPEVEWTPLTLPATGGGTDFVELGSAVVAGPALVLVFAAVLLVVLVF
ncbi:hypothetical protein AB0878_16380 [Amycolatopsis sp. NPDC047767]|uniref:hypothetical protein n=1 Tax=Amycolatopsis sp. NPDC047767 TaxID=3156765 RepID=UPI003451BE82